VSVSVEQRLHALRKLRLCPFDIPPRRHTAHDRTYDHQQLGRPDQNGARHAGCAGCRGRSASRLTGRPVCGGEVVSEQQGH
jgi:hypothetical protein